MRREETNPFDCETATGAVADARRTGMGAGRYGALVRTAACATEQIEHS